MVGGWDERVAVPPALQDRPFRASEAYAAGISPTALQGSRFRRLFHDVHVTASTPDSLFLRTAAARLVLPPEAQVSHETAAELLGLPAPRHGEIVVAVPRGVERPQVSGVEAHESVDLEDGVVIRGLTFVQPYRLFLQMPTRLDLVELVVLGDAMVRRGLATPGELVVACDTARRRRGLLLARRAARLVRARVDSPQESRTRMLLVLAGLPEPATGTVVVDEHGQWLACPDLVYERWRLAVEFDGETHGSDRKQWRDDVFRREVLDDHGWRLVVVTADDLRHRPELTLHRICRRLAEAGCPVRTSDLLDEWRRYFGRGRRTRGVT